MTTPTTVQVRLQIRADTAANWTSFSPVLLANELGLETDTKKFKIGDGNTSWQSLAYFPSIVSGGTVLGNLEIGTTGTLTFEGSTANGFETTLGVVDPTADRTILLPNQSGTVVVGGNASIVDADIAANAEIAVSKLADGAARQLLQTDAAGTGVEWTSNIDIPGTLDVTGAATFDGAVTVAGDLTVNGTTTTISTQNLLVEDKNIILGDVATPTDVTADGGGITLKGATDKTINWIDSTDAWTSSERFSVPLGSAAAPSLTFTSDENTGIYSPGADQVAISTNSSGRLFIDANGNVGINTASTIAPGGFGYAREFALTGATSGDSSAAINIRGSRTVSGGFGDINFWHQSTSNRAYIQARRGSSDSAIDLDFITSGGAGMRITSAGLVGVGTSSPGSYTEAPYFVVANTSGNCGATIVSSASGYGALYFADGTTGDEKYRGGLTYYHNYAGIVDKLAFTAGAVNRMTLTPTGLGVGTTSPAYPLDLGTSNDGRARQWLATTSFIGDQGDSTGFQIRALGAGTSGMKFANYANNVEYGRFDSSGRLGIGTSSPASLLNIKGSAANGFSLTHSNNTVISELYELSGAQGAGLSLKNSSGTTNVFFNAGGDSYINGGRVGIGTTPVNTLDVNGTARIRLSGNSLVVTTEGGAPYLQSEQNVPLHFGTNSQLRATLDASGRLLVGTSSARTNFFNTVAGTQLQVEGTTYQSSSLSLVATGNNSYDAGTLVLGKGRGNAVGSNTIVQNGTPPDILGYISFQGNDGSEFVEGASIKAEVDGGVGANDLPSRLVFSTTADGASSPTERMRIRSDGKIQIGGTGITDARLNVVTSASERLGQFISQNTGGDAATFGLYIGKYSNDSTTTQRFIGFSINNDGSGCGQINANGSGQAAFGTFSDQRLKENIQDLPSQLGLIKALRPVEFDFKDGNGHQLGFIAQEMQQVYPDVVSEQDGYLTITGFGKTECRLIKALQEAVAKIEALEAKVAALESA